MEVEPTDVCGELYVSIQCDESDVDKSDEVTETSTTDIAESHEWKSEGGNLVVDRGAIEQFFGILLFSGYHCVPSENTFWSTAEDMQLNALKI
ncbi:hypothetical protein T4C_7053 [Trichinella pseudospiralis]|uniref:PiggyBac transposable element-derived protein domain-containing protein n=1 Tax=Trichinella pseudospiralis TaxID=6337 RepID=A0A0V1IWW5_TRIPS|nr:hypothetical protein T4C_7053 [Trichinella pseudospiralis]